MGTRVHAVGRLGDRRRRGHGLRSARGRQAVGRQLHSRRPRRLISDIWTQRHRHLVDAADRRQQLRQRPAASRPTRRTSRPPTTGSSRPSTRRHGWGTVATNCLHRDQRRWRRARAWSRPGAATTAAAVGSNGGTDDGIYQYDAHRVPWRLGLDACWNGTHLGKHVPDEQRQVLPEHRLADERRRRRRPHPGHLHAERQPSTAMRRRTPCRSSARRASARWRRATAFASTAYQFILDASYSPASTIRTRAAGLLHVLQRDGRPADRAHDERQLQPP